MTRMIRPTRPIRPIAVSLVSLSATTLVFAQAPAQPAPAGNGAAMPAHPNLWPQDVTSNGKTYRVFQPRTTGLDGARAYFVTEVSMTGADGKTVTGQAQLQAEVMAADVPGEVEVNQFAVRGLTVDGKPAAAEDVKALSQALYVVAMTTTRSNLVQGMQLVNARGASTPGISHAVPSIVVTHRPSVLVSVVGKARMAPLASTGWSSVTNTPFVLLKSADGSWWTKVGGAWQTSSSMESGYAPANGAPPSDVIAALGKAPAMPADAASVPTLVQKPALKPASAVVATTPTVLVSIDGPTQLADACPGVKMVKNTNSTLLTTDGSSFYLLSAGRWFTTSNLDAGPWSYVAPGDVPAEFLRLPRSKRFDPARAAVSGTAEANEAILAAREIRTVTLDRADAQPMLKVDGAAPTAKASWQPIEGTQLQWLPGASQPTVMCEGKVYCCDSGAWFTAQSVAGPWKLCDKVPSAVYAIPPSCPIYPCTYVWVFGSTPDTVSFGFSPGYLGTYVVDGTPVYGTGVDYPQASGSFQAYPQTYGTDPTYDSQSGTFAPPDDPNDDYAYYGAADVNPYYMGGDGWYGWGWCPGWNTAWAAGWNNWWGWDNWGWWMNQWHPYYNRWNNAHAAWETQDRADAAKRVAQRNVPLNQRNWPAARGDMAKAGSAQIRPAGAAARRDASPAAAAENQQAIDRQFAGAAADAPAAFRGYGNEYAGYSPDAYRAWTGAGSNLGGNWGYSPLAAPNGFHPPQQFTDPGAYWGSSTRLGNNVGPNAGPYHSPEGHGGWGSYDHWAGEGVRGTEYDGANRGGSREGGGRR